MKGPARDPFELTLEVTRLRRLAEHVLGLTLAHPAGEALPRWTPGAHIDLRLPSGQIRSYSLCGDPEVPNVYEIAVALEEAGRGGSREMHREPVVGRQLASSLPVNDFALVDAPEYLFIAGGIGITPILPMLRMIGKRDVPWSVVYLGRTRGRLSFLDELEDIVRQAAGYHRVMIKDEGASLDLPTLLATVRSGTAVYCCGPNRLLDEAAALQNASEARYTLHIERFGRPQSTVDEADAVEGSLRGSGLDSDATTPCDPNGPFEVELRRTGAVLKIEAGESILGQARKLRNGLTYSCSSGYCGTCETRVIAGVPDHRDDVLSEEEKAGNNTMMICVGRSRTKRLVIDL